MGKIAAACGLAFAVLIAVGSSVSAQTLDQKAWNAVWDRLERRLAAPTPDHVVHVLRFPVPMTWGVDRTRAARQQLANLAGIVPGETFSIDPRNEEQRLHDRYLTIAGDIEPPIGYSEEQWKKVQAALDDVTSAWEEVLEVNSRLNDMWATQKGILEAAGEPADSLAMDDFFRRNSKLLQRPFRKLKEANDQVQRLTTAGQYVTLSLLALADSVASVYTAQNPIPWDYEGDFSVAKQIASDCDDSVPNQWEEISFGTVVSSEQIRTSGWSGNGSYDGFFFSISGGAGGDEYTKVITKEGDRVSLRLCNLSYVNVAPGDWFSMDLLKRIDRGDLTLKEGATIPRPILGPEGYIPRLVSGLIVARRVVFEARLDRYRLDEIRRNIAGDAGVRIGPFQIGGRGSRSEYSKREDTADGGYRFGTSYTVPVILAVVTEATLHAGE